jgi:hypothetical protein
LLSITGRAQDDLSPFLEHRMSDKLESAIETVAAKVRRFKSRPIGEQNTKASLIEPILEALGWDIRDPDEVHREFKPTPKDSPVDYALKLLRKPRLFVEAKGLGENLSDRKWIAQVLGYAVMAGVEWCVLTDGDEIRFYNATAPVDAEEKLFWQIRLSEVPAENAAKTLRLISRANMEENLLETLWAAHFIDRQVRDSLVTLIQSADKNLVNLIRSKARKLSAKEIAHSLRRLDTRIEQPAIFADLSSSPTDAEQAEKWRQAGIKAAKKRRENAAKREKDQMRAGEVVSIETINRGTSRGAG